MARSIVLTYERTSVFQMGIEGKDLTALATHLGIDRKELLEAIRDEDLDGFSDELTAFVDEHAVEGEMTEEGDVESLEIEYIND